MQPTAPTEGKQQYIWSDNVRFGSLPKVERKVITKMTNKAATKSFDNSAICTGEIAGMLMCLEESSWKVPACLPEISTLQQCYEIHKGDPDPRIMAKHWQGMLRQRVFQYFAKQKSIGRFR